MKPDSHQDQRNGQWQRCQCGWVGSSKQLAVWVRKDQLVSRICPHCGTPSPTHNRLLIHGQHSQLVH